jgi:hypothetical protein
VVMDTGPGYSTKRQEAVTAMLPLLGKNEHLMEVAGDLIFRNMDFPGSEIIADRLAAANPLAQIDAEAADIPPAVQMQIKQLQATQQKLTQELQGAQLMLKSRGDVEQMRQQGETQRELMRNIATSHHIHEREDTARADTATRAHAAMVDTHLRAETTARDTVLKTHTQVLVEKIKGAFALALAQIDKEAAENAEEETTERAV